jgi:F0F1-type ATP synthase membrane subunit b/b'
MKALRSISCSLVVCALGLFSSVTTFAAEEGNSSVEQPIGLTFKWIHFVILVLLAYWLFGKVLPPFFRKNADNISAAITKATAAKAEAERKLQDAASKLSNLEREVAEFRVSAQREAAAEVERLRTATLLDVEKIRAAAKTEIAAAERAARMELKELAAKLAVDGAESLVAQQMTPSVQEAMINSFVQSLQGRPN